MYLQCFSLVDRYLKRKPNRAQFGIEDFHASGAQKAAV